MEKVNSSTKGKVKSSMLKTGSRTYFFDVNLASNNKKYLKVTETRFVKGQEDRVRNSVVLFPEDIQEFQKNLNEMVGYL